MNGKVHVEVINSCQMDEVPVLVGNTTRLQLSMLQGRLTVQVCRCVVLQCLIFCLVHFIHILQCNIEPIVHVVR